jgi:hypothetical protein
MSYMNMIKTAMSCLTDTSTIITRMKMILREIDPNFPTAENEFRDGVIMLRKAIGTENTTCVDDMLLAQDQRIASNLVFLVWSGLHQNLSCFHNSANKLYLKLDFEDIHQEHMLYSMPTTIRAQKQIEKAYQNIPSKLCYLTEPITLYYSYLETIAYKLAHYFGFLLADEFLYWVVPGYCHDNKVTSTYRMELSKYLNMDLFAL